MRSQSRHGPIAQLIIAWSPLSLLLVAYAVVGWISAPLSNDGAVDQDAVNRLGLGVHVADLADLERSVFGVVPSAWLQDRLVDGSPHWWDAVAALVYVTHFVTIPLVTALAWFCWRPVFRRWIAAVIAFTVVGMGGYVVVPSAPPWLASEQGVIADIDRISALGWDYLHLDGVAWLTASGQAGSNPVAAVPSLHAGAALLVVLFVWSRPGRVARAALAAYVLAMALTLVYTGEHYVVDVVAGWLTAVVAVLVARLVPLRSESGPPPDDVTHEPARTRECTGTVRGTPTA